MVLQKHSVMCVFVYVQVSADLTPETQSRVGVQFTLFKILGLLPIKAPDSAKGQLDTTFVDEELRISRGDKGKFAHTYRSCIVVNRKDKNVLVILQDLFRWCTWTCRL